MMLIDPDLHEIYTKRKATVEKGLQIQIYSLKI